MTSLLLIYFQLLSSIIFGADTLKIVFVGDLMQHKEQLSAALKPGKSPILSSSYNYNDYFYFLKDELFGYHIKGVNIETTFGKPPYSGYPMFNSPSSLAVATKNAGFNLFLAANNHSGDRGREGIEGSMQLFKDLNIYYTGISRKESSNEVLIIDTLGFKVAILNYTYGTNGNKIPNGLSVNLIDSTFIESQLDYLKSKDINLIIATLHWGDEYKLTQNSYQTKWETFFHRRGVKYIIGSHPHVVQPHKLISFPNESVNGFTAYSLGNFISNMTAPNTRFGQIVKLHFVKINGSVALSDFKIEYLWSARPGEVLKNYTIVPYKIVKEKKEIFLNKNSYNQMIFNYQNINND